jgi:hypothetical protein
MEAPKESQETPDTSTSRTLGAGIITPEDRAGELGVEIFKKLLLDADVKNQEGAVLLVNVVTYLACLVQNNFYAYGRRDDFANGLADILKNNKGSPPTSPESSDSPEHPEKAQEETTSP